jgi:hypothetical protein
LTIKPHPCSESDTHQHQHRPQESLRLTKWQLEDKPQRQGSLDRVIGELSLGTKMARG